MPLRFDPLVSIDDMKTNPFRIYVDWGYLEDEYNDGTIPNRLWCPIARSPEVPFSDLLDELECMKNFFDKLEDNLKQGVSCVVANNNKSVFNLSNSELRNSRVIFSMTKRILDELKEKYE